MASPPLRKLLWAAGVGGVVAVAVRALRGDPAPQFSNHPTVDGGDRSRLVPDPTAPTPAAEDDPLDDPLDAATADLVEAVVNPVADVAADELPGHGQPQLPLDPESRHASEASGQAAGAAEAEPAETEPAATPKPIPPAPPMAEDPAAETWVFPVDGACPDGYPVKAKIKSGVFHVPGGAMYERTHADRCYRTEEAAEADGLRAAKR